MVVSRKERGKENLFREGWQVRKRFEGEDLRAAISHARLYLPCTVEAESWRFSSVLFMINSVQCDLGFSLKAICPKIRMLYILLLVRWGEISFQKLVFGRERRLLIPAWPIKGNMCVSVCSGNEWEMKVSLPLPPAAEKKHTSGS